ncbi:UDP-N-acetyl glucosamine 2-epimerase [Roseomonas harenae]|uniref:UDP-N-acetyl glucosamine 2-epimerase n=1 Tax=Muricoccus harenae TaxID=2692566 RepID=UPI001F19494E|nr:UDP-N-acetyl glucosamine 2-epimerase [Roseomonas harenae]
MLPELHLIAAARPNLPKLAALLHALAEVPPFCTPVLIHTGQHHDAAMFGAHLADLGLPRPTLPSAFPAAAMPPSLAAP